MKKTLVALAVLAASGASFAQVTLTGGVDFTWGKGVQDANGAAATKGIYSSDAYVDFTAVDDIGGGLKSTVMFELNTDGTRATAYGGDKSVVLSNAMGSLTLVNTRTGGLLGSTMLAPTVQNDDHWSAVNAAVMSRSEIDALAVKANVAAGASVYYKYLELNPGTAPAVNGSAQVLGGSYATGALTVGAEYVSYTFSDAYRATKAYTDLRTSKITAAASYDLGAAKVALGYESANAGTSEATSSGTAASLMTLGVAAPLGAATVGLNYGKRDGSSFTEVGVNYALSKRTFVGASYATFTNPNVSNQDSFGIRLGQSF